MEKGYKELILFFLLIPIFSLFLCSAEPLKINEADIIERLTRVEEGLKRVEEGQRAIIREMDKRFEAIDKRFESIEKRFDQMINLFIAIVGAFTAIVAVSIGFAIWDRRSMIRPFETKVKSIEEELAGNKKTLHSLLEALRELSKKDEKLLEILKKFSLL